jgi:hypothetical protein
MIRRCQIFGGNNRTWPLFLKRGSSLSDIQLALSFLQERGEVFLTFALYREAEHYFETLVFTYCCYTAQCPTPVKKKSIPLQVWTGLEGPRRLRGSHISRQLAHECGKVVSPTHRPPLLPSKYS